MKTIPVIIAGVAVMAIATVSLWANPTIQQQHLMMIDNMEGGCSFCHNPKTGIEQKKLNMLKGQANYAKIGTFGAAGCNRCHTGNGLTPAGVSAKTNAGL